MLSFCFRRKNPALWYFLVSMILGAVHTYIMYDYINHASKGKKRNTKTLKKGDIKEFNEEYK